MKKNNLKKKTLSAVTAFALLATLAGTFAWFTSNDNKVNHFEGRIANERDIEVVETFEPPIDWEPGMEVNKDVTIANVGEASSLIRLTFEESLQLLADPSGKTTNGAELEGKADGAVYLLPATVPAGYTVSTFAGTAPKLTVTAGAYAGTYTLVVYEKATGNQYSYRYYLRKTGGALYSASGIDSFTRDTANKIAVRSGAPVLNYIDLTYGARNTYEWTTPYAAAFASAGDNRWTTPAGIDSNIQLTFNNLTTDPTTPNKWYYNQADGYFYYTSVVDKQNTTAQLVDSVTLLGSATNDYSKLLYDLNVKGEGISAYKGAVDEWLPAGVNDALANALKATVPAQ